jgi:hypothetical protein
MRLPSLAAAALAAGALALTPAAATAAVRTGVDRAHGVAFRLDGRVLTARLLPSAPRRTRRQVLGRRVFAFCGFLSDQELDGAFVFARRRWARGARAVRFTFPADVSRRAESCDLYGGTEALVAEAELRRAPRFAG